MSVYQWAFEMFGTAGPWMAIAAWAVSLAGLAALVIKIWIDMDRENQGDL